MGIHIHTKGRPDMCRCCAIVDRLNELWNRTHNSVLSVNGIYADGNGNVLIPGIQDISDLREEIQALGERVTNNRTYLEAVAEDVAEIGTLIPSLATLNTEQTFTAAKYLSVIGTGNYAMVNKEWIKDTGENADNGLLHRTGDEWKQGELGLKTPAGEKACVLKALDTGADIRLWSTSRNGRSNRQARLELIMGDNNTAILRLQIRTLDDQYVTYTDIASITG